MLYATIEPVGTQKIKTQAHLDQWYLIPQIKPKR